MAFFFFKSQSVHRVPLTVNSCNYNKDCKKFSKVDNVWSQEAGEKEKVENLWALDTYTLKTKQIKQAKDSKKWAPVSLNVAVCDCLFSFRGMEPKILGYNSEVLLGFYWIFLITTVNRCKVSLISMIKHDSPCTPNLPHTKTHSLPGNQLRKCLSGHGHN